MFLQVIKTAPDPTAWTPLADHQSATPTSFSAPVLHFHCANTQIALSSDQKSLISEFFSGEEESSSVAAETVPPTTAQDESNAPTGEGEGVVDEEGAWEEDTGPMMQDVTIENVDIYVTNRYDCFLLFKPFDILTNNLTSQQIHTMVALSVHRLRTHIPTNYTPRHHQIKYNR